MAYVSLCADCSNAIAEKSRGVPEKMPENNGLGMIHIYAQSAWHAPSHIFGTRGDLLKLAEAIRDALEDGEGDCGTYTADGEGYQVEVYLCSDEEMNMLPLPYTEDYAKGSTPEQEAAITRRIMRDE